MKITKTMMFIETLKRSLQYNVVEIGFLVIFLYHIWVPMLWLGFVATVLWVLVTSIKEAEMELFQGLKARELYMTDFMSSVLVFLALAWVVRHESYQFPIMYVVAAIQHMRYTVLSYNCLMKERRYDKAHPTDKDEQSSN